MHRQNQHLIADTAIVTQAESQFLFILMQLQYIPKAERCILSVHYYFKSVCCGIYLDSCLHYEMDEPWALGILSLPKLWQLLHVELF